MALTMSPWPAGLNLGSEPESELLKITSAPAPQIDLPSPVITKSRSTSAAIHKCHGMILPDDLVV